MSNHDEKETSQPKVAEEELSSRGAEVYQDRILTLEAQMRTMLDELSLLWNSKREGEDAPSTSGRRIPIGVELEPTIGDMGPPREETTPFFGQRGRIPTWYRSFNH